MSAQGSDEWFAARLGRATASRFADVLATTKTGAGASRKNYLAQLVVERITGQRAESYTNAAMQWGTDTEPLARAAYSAATGNEVQECGFIRHGSLMAGASPDGMVEDDGLIEIKCPNTATHIETLLARRMPSRYQAQVQGQLWIADKLWCDFVSYDSRMPVDLQLAVYRVERDNTYISKLYAEVVAFLIEVEATVEKLNELSGG